MQKSHRNATLVAFKYAARIKSVSSVTVCDRLFPLMLSMSSLIDTNGSCHARRIDWQMIHSSYRLSRNWLKQLEKHVLFSVSAHIELISLTPLSTLKNCIPNFYHDFKILS